VLLPMALCSGCSCDGSGAEGGEMCSLLTGRAVCCCQWCCVLVVAVIVPGRRLARCVHC
jgi:hypothetical protein